MPLIVLQVTFMWMIRLDVYLKKIETFPWDLSVCSTSISTMNRLQRHEPHFHLYPSWYIMHSWPSQILFLP